MRTATAIVALLLALASAGCGACGSTTSTVALPDGGLARSDENDAGAITKAACVRYCGASSDGLALQQCSVNGSEVDCAFTNNVMCLKTGKTD